MNKTILVLCALLAGCLSTRTQNQVTVPAMVAAWSGGLRADVLMADEPPLAEVEAMDLALAESPISRTALGVVDIVAIEVAALDGIQNQVDQLLISEGVAASLQERLRQFVAAYDEVLTPVVAQAAPLVITRSSWATGPPPAIAGEVWR